MDTSLYEDGLTPDQLRIKTLIAEARTVSDLLTVVQKAWGWMMLDIDEYGRLNRYIANNGILYPAECKQVLAQSLLPKKES